MKHVYPLGALFKKGVIAPGMQADLTILNKDPAQSPVDSLLDLRVEMTIINGESAWEKG
jgi:predicted amidohydrolase YtcJ